VPNVPPPIAIEIGSPLPWWAAPAFGSKIGSSRCTS
jgi:hypothetical protein